MASRNTEDGIIEVHALATFGRGIVRADVTLVAPVMVEHCSVSVIGSILSF
ncbi:hypothetical protein RGAI101_3267 [Roseobacter sp. GAI101]|nr:hypothetical protein RGAI101_3267 [Roseobacter sp. GAI101]